MEANSYHFYELEGVVKGTLRQGLKEIYDLNLAEDEIALETPPQPEFGDLSTPLPLRLAKALRRPPLEIAGQLRDYLASQELPHLKEFTVTAPGYVNLWLDMPNLTRSVFDEITVDKEKYGEVKAGKGKKC